MSCNTQAFNLGIRHVIIGENRKQKFCITTKPGTNLGGKFFVVHEPVTQAKHYFWFDTGSSTDPAVPNATGHKVDILTTDSAIQVANKLKTELLALSWIASVTQNDEHLEIKLNADGYAYEARDAIDPLKATKFKIVVTQFGSQQVDAGPTNGDISLTIEEQLQDVTSPQTGDFVIAQIRRGVSISASFELKDTSEAAIRRAISWYGGTYVTDDADSKVISGYGSKNLFKSTEDVSIPVIFREPDMAEDNDPSKDLMIPKAKLSLGELTFSAENELVLPVTVTGYLKTTGYAGVNALKFGDSTKLN